jgi:hypothetical protein
MQLRRDQQTSWKAQNTINVHNQPDTWQVCIGLAHLSDHDQLLKLAAW